MLAKIYAIRRVSGINKVSSYGSLPCIGIAARRSPWTHRQMRGRSDGYRARTRVSPSRCSHRRGIIKEGTEGERRARKEIKNDNPDARTHALTLTSLFTSPPFCCVLHLDRGNPPFRAILDAFVMIGTGTHGACRIVLTGWK